MLAGASHQPTSTSMAIAAILSTINPLWTLLPERTPRQLISTSSASAETPITLSGTAECVSSLK